MTRATTRDAAGALVLTVVGVIELFARPDIAIDPFGLVQVVLVCGAVAGRRAAPLVAVVVAAAGELISPAMHLPTDTTADNIVTPAAAFTTCALLVLMYSVAAHETRRDLAIVGGLLLLGATWAGDLMKGSLLNEFLASLVGTGLAWTGGRLVGTARRQAGLLREANAELTIQRARAAAAATEAERYRIARDLHDVLAHSLTVVAVQADAADALLPDRPDDAQRAVVAIRATAQNALGEMRRLLGTLRPDPMRAKQALGLADLSDLIDEVHGGRVDVRIDGDQVALPEAVDRSAFRILQEALTNARRHGSGAPVDVALSYGPDAVEISVFNELGTPGTGAPGFGLIGVRERAHALGGSVEAGPSDGGWVLRACLPLVAP